MVFYLKNWVFINKELKGYCSHPNQKETAYFRFKQAETQITKYRLFNFVSAHKINLLGPCPLTGPTPSIWRI